MAMFALLGWGEDMILSDNQHFKTLTSKTSAAIFPKIQEFSNNEGLARKHPRRLRSKHVERISRAVFVVQKQQIPKMFFRNNIF